MVAQSALCFFAFTGFAARSLLPRIGCCVVAVILLAAASAPAQICGDQLWEQDPCEFCGQDALFESGTPEMNHDCITSIIDFAYFAADYGQTGPGLSGDFNGDLEVNLDDLAPFAAHFFANHGSQFAGCEPCGVLPDSCGGRIRLTFDPVVLGEFYDGELDLGMGTGINADPPPDSIGVGCEPLPPDPVCHDLIWQEDECEFCGRDAYVTTGAPEMTHDCVVEIIDFALFVQEYQLTGEGLSGDFNGDHFVDFADFGIFAAAYDDPVSPCNPCGEIPDSCAGTVRVSFASDLTDVDQLDLSPYVPAIAYIVADSCPGLAAAHVLVYLTPNVYVSSVLFPHPLTLSNETAPYSPPFDAGANLLATVHFYVTDDAAAMLGVRGSGESGAGKLQWVQVDPLRRMGFERIAYGGINTEPQSDSLGCASSSTPGRWREPQLCILLESQPNPATRSTACSFSLPRAGEATVCVSDASGRIVRRLHDGWLGIGRHSIVWDGRGDSGAPVAAGAYFIRLRGQELRATSRLIWLR